MVITCVLQIKTWLMKSKIVAVIGVSCNFGNLDFVLKTRFCLEAAKTIEVLNKSILQLSEMGQFYEYKFLRFPKIYKINKQYKCSYHYKLFCFNISVIQ